MSIYKEILGNQFYKMHPMLQKRYGFKNGKTFKATGVMHEITSGPKWLYLFKLFAARRKFLFPEHGNNIPFHIVNKPQIGSNGEQQVHWERRFYFPNNNRDFNALMTLDIDKELVKDYLGEPSLIYSELTFEVTDQGHLRIESQKQRLVLGKFELPIPKSFQGNVLVKESYVKENESFCIHVWITNPLIGTLFEYKGEFRADDL
ncbi:protein of unknown function [Paenisporosarcina quisquiliarum]|uniref:DUF4166 domain-containing protein n=1 Tax=Psychrobacillus psychrodurans TaxID=126157 RepID=UPI0008AC0EA5|nr:DUF4166 domain-containing protein [Psychrobacillus psychrodurans]MCZ8539685.1 DUF4166 domain-containing protein [Psychrobacillus psychrodurans]SEN72503.1 protein of unknown function [Paenisporosarcina quisquiliarum]SFM94479.1 protein of unknown function [Psychrobacillus psychrodurans]